MNIDYIKAFLNYDDKPIEKDWFRTAMIIDIIILFVGVYFCKYKIIEGILCVIISFAMISFYYYINKKIELNKKNKILFYGAYMYLMSICLNYLSFQLINKIWEAPILLFTILFFSTGMTTIGTYYILTKRICAGKYLEMKISKKSNIKIYSFIALGLILFRSLRNNLSANFDYLLVGILTGALGVLWSTNIYFIIKYKYFKFLEHEITL